METAIFISTQGSVLARLLEIPYFKDKVACVISDRNCGAIQVAEKAGVTTQILPAITGAEFSEKVLKQTNIAEFDLFISFYTRLFTNSLLDHIKDRLVNLHPSILPAYPGMDGFGDTVKGGAQFFGSTIHFIDEGVDTGLPIIQSAVPYDPNKSEAELRHQVFIDQCRTLLQVVRWFEEKRVTVVNSRVVVANTRHEEGRYSPALDFDQAVSFESPGTKPGSIAAGNKNKILDLRQGTNHPYGLPYSEIYQNVLLTGKLSEGRSQPGFALTAFAPFLIALRKAAEFGINRPEVAEVIAESLADYYDLVQPHSAAEWLGVETTPENALSSAPPWAAVFPWRARTLQSYRQAYERAALKENKSVGLDLDITDGWLFCGPVASEKIKAESLRLQYVLRQIYNHGYKRWDSPEGDVKATALVDESGNWRWLITAGNHRAAAAAALDYGEIPIRVNLVISRNQVAYWPHVVNGLYSEAGALQVFDQFFDGTTPHIAEHWIQAQAIHQTEVKQEAVE